MATLSDYLKWRGDLTFAQAPVNEVDSLLFSLISYVDFDGIIDGNTNGKGDPFRAVANSYFTKHPETGKFAMGVLVPSGILNLFREMKDTARFSTVGVKGYVNHIDTAIETQFSAVTFVLDDGTQVVTYRGTDDTIIGWKENFKMSYLEEVPAQKEAVEYLNRVASESDGDIYVTGHSKGGNLSVYAGVCCDDKYLPRIRKIWGNDGPGFSNGLWESQKYLDRASLVECIVPESSLVGILMAHKKDCTVIKSSSVGGAMQHNGLTWECVGNHFIHLDSVSTQCRHSDMTLNEWISEMTPEQREQFTESLFDFLSVGKALTLTDVLSSFTEWGKHRKNLDSKVWETLNWTMKLLIKSGGKTMLEELRKKL